MKKKYIILLMLLLSVFSAVSLCYSRDNDEWIYKQKKLYLIKSGQELNEVLADINKRFPVFEDRLRAIALMRIGTPYLGGCLGEETAPDTEPLFRWDVSDCTVFVITCSALAHAGNLDGARKMMEVLNYYNPPEAGDKAVNYNNRIHFTYDRINNNPYFKDITKDLIPEGRLSKVKLTLNRKSDTSKLINIPWEKKVEAYYIPSIKINKKFLEKLPPVCGVAFVREENFPLGIVVSHEGMLIDNKRLIHADSADKKVTDVDFMDYYFNICKGYFDGIIIYKFL
ncbi:MAG: N-acetylmuramoyl-L-alanine amidase-like domain-containing protein [Armatimonadota bacterium]